MLLVSSSLPSALGSLFHSRRRQRHQHAADLGGMAEATQLITGIRSLNWIPVYALFIRGLLFLASYKLIAKLFKYLTLVLFAYVFASFYAHVDWKQAVTFVPHLEWSRGFLAVLVAISGHHDFSLSLLLAGRSGG